MKKIFLVVVFCVLAVINVNLLTSFVHAKEEQAQLKMKIAMLKDMNEIAANDFSIKQDHMRSLLNNQEFVNQVIRSKEGHIKPQEKIFKFAD